MFYLRTVSEEHGTQNIFLGQRYRVITKSKSPKEFKNVCEDRKVNYDLLRKIIIYDIGHQIFIISDESKDKQYIVTENGNTYEKL